MSIYCPQCGKPHKPLGSHEEDSGEWTCGDCGFRFVVDIEYSPEYYTTCRDHEWGYVPIDGYEACKICRSMRLTQAQEADY
jgi:DNA-directed RNA polymerase subunit RPC12/RpoP